MGVHRQVSSVIHSFLALVRRGRARSSLGVILAIVTVLCVTGISRSSPPVPVRLAASANGIWIASGQSVSRIDLATNQISQTIALAQEPKALAPAAWEGELWILTQDSLLKFDANSNPVLKLDLPALGNAADQTEWLRVNPDDASLWIAADKTLLHLDAQGMTLSQWTAPDAIRSLASGLDGSPWILTQTSLIHLSTQGASLKDIDLKSTGQNFTNLAIDSVGSVAWVGSEQTLVRVNLLDPAQTSRTIALPKEGNGDANTAGEQGATPPLALNPFTGELWLVANASLLQFDRAGNLMTTLDLRAQKIQNPDTLVFEPINQNVWLAVQDTLFRFSATGELLATIDLSQKSPQPGGSGVTNGGAPINMPPVAAPKAPTTPKPKAPDPVGRVSNPSNGITVGTVSLAPNSANAPGTSAAPTPPVATPTDSVPLKTSESASVIGAQVYGRIPLSFELNQGQTHESVKFLTRSAGHAVFLTPRETVLALRNPKHKSAREDNTLAGARKAGPRSRAAQRNADSVASALDVGPPSTVVRMSLVGAQPNPPVEGLELLETKSHYLIGNDPKKWITDVPHYAKVKHHDVYPGIDQIFYGTEGRLEYDLVVNAGADPARIRLAFDGATQLQLNDQGDLILQTALGPVTHRKPLVYQNIGAERRLIEGRYRVRGGEIGIEVQPYDPSQPLVIDPFIIYSTYLGGSGDQFGAAIAVGSDGSAYVTGSVWSPDFPTVNPVQGSNAGSTDAFVAKLSPDGKTLIYATYVGGNNSDWAYGIAVDSLGSAYIAGETTSANFPKVAAAQSTLKGGDDAFVAKLNATGNALVYSTYLGGNGFDYATSIAVDANKNAYITGQASAGFPVKNAYKSTAPSDYPAFVTKLTSTGALSYSTYLGGVDSETGYGIAVDSTGSAYVVGDTGSANFPTKNPIAAYPCPGIFVTKFSSTGTSLTYSTCISDGQAQPWLFSPAGIALDAQKNAYIVGTTSSTAFPVVNAFQSTNRSTEGSNNAFVSKLNAAGSALVYSTYLGGSTADAAFAIAVDPNGSAYVTGASGSSDFPLANPLSGVARGPGDIAFVTKFSPTGNTVAYSTYLGGTDGAQYGAGIAVDGNLNAYVTGDTTAANFPVVNPIKSTNPTLTEQAFVAKISSANLPATTINLTASAATLVAGQPVTLTATVAGSAPTGSVTFNDGSTGLGTVNLSGTSASLTVSTLAPGAHSITARYSGDAANASSLSTPVSVTVNSPPVVNLTAPSSGTFFIAPATINITADASVSGGSVSKVDFYQGTTLLSTATSSPYNYVWTNVAVGTYTLTARATSAAGLVTTSSPVTVTVLTAPTIAVTGLTDGAVITDDTLTITGTVQAPPNSSITVNGIVGTIGPDGRFVVSNVPLAPGANTLTITVTTPDGKSTTQTISVTRNGQAAFAFSASPIQGLAPLMVNFTLANRNNVAYARADLSCLGNSTVDRSVTAPTTALGTCLYTTVGIYTPQVKVFDGQNQVIYTGTQTIQVGSVNAQDSMLRDVYYNMLARLKVRDINGALNYVTSGVHDKYNAVFTALDAVSSTNLATVVNQLGTIQSGVVGADMAEYTITRNQSGTNKAFLMYLIRGEDGIWRMDGM